MANSKARPRAGDPPQLNQAGEILQELLTAERARLKTALRIEDERSIVFPETSVIVRDILKIMAEINSKADVSPSEDDNLLDDVTIDM